MRATTSALLAVLLVALASCSVPPLKTYAYPAWGFSISLRAAPTVTLTPAAAAGGGSGGIKVEAVVAGRDFLVAVADGSASPKSDDEILSEFPESLAQGGTLTKQTYVATGAVTGREILIDKPGQETQRVRIFVSHQRLYEVSAQSSLGPTDPEVDEFLDSFQLTTPAP
jgi:hypothetical protein